MFISFIRQLMKSSSSNKKAFNEPNPNSLSDSIEVIKRRESYNKLQFFQNFLKYKYPHLDLSVVFNKQGEIAGISVYSDINEEDNAQLTKIIYCKDYEEYFYWIDKGKPKNKNYYCKIKICNGDILEVIDTNAKFYVTESGDKVFKKENVELLEKYDRFTYL